MPTVSVDTLKNNLTNPARTYLWEVLIPSPIGGGDSDALRIRCMNAAIPGRSFGVIHVPYQQSGGTQFPGKLNYSHAWEATFIEGEDVKIHDAIYNWKQSVIDDYDGIGNGDDLIKSDIYLTMITTAGAVYMKFKLIGCYPTSVGDVAVSQDADGDGSRLMFPVTFSYDRWERVA